MCRYDKTTDKHKRCDFAKAKGPNYICDGLNQTAIRGPEQNAAIQALMGLDTSTRRTNKSHQEDMNYGRQIEYHNKQTGLLQQAGQAGPSRISNVTPPKMGHVSPGSVSSSAGKGTPRNMTPTRGRGTPTRGGGTPVTSRAGTPARGGGTPTRGGKAPARGGAGSPRGQQKPWNYAATGSAESDPWKAAAASSSSAARGARGGGPVSRASTPSRAGTPARGGGTPSRGGPSTRGSGLHVRGGKAPARGSGRGPAKK